MNKTVTKVFVIIGILVLCLVIWNFVFDTGGLAETVYTAVANTVNDVWATVAGSGADPLLPAWSGGSTETLDGATGLIQ